MSMSCLKSTRDRMSERVAKKSGCEYYWRGRPGSNRSRNKRPRNPTDRQKHSGKHAVMRPEWPLRPINHLSLRVCDRQFAGRSGHSDRHKNCASRMAVSGRVYGRGWQATQ